jgi:hypothetical protein
MLAHSGASHELLRRGFLERRLHLPLTETELLLPFHPIGG